MADPAEEALQDQKANEAPAPPPIQDFEQRMEARLQAFEQRVFDTVGRVVQGRQGQEAAAPAEQEVTEEEIEQALEAGDSKKAAKLLRRQQRYEMAALKKDLGGQLGQATQLVAQRLAKFSAVEGAKLPYYTRFKREIDETISSRGIDATDPDNIKLVHDLIAAQHMPEIIKGEVEAARRAALEEGEETGIKKSGGRRRRAPEAGEKQEYREVALSEDLRDEMEELGYEDPNDFALARNFEDPSGQGRHWDYMHHVGRKREREATRGNGRTKAGMASFIGRLKNQKQFYAERGEARKLARLQSN